MVYVCYIITFTTSIYIMGRWKHQISAKSSHILLLPELQWQNHKQHPQIISPTSLVFITNTNSIPKMTNEATHLALYELNWDFAMWLPVHTYAMFVIYQPIEYGVQNNSICNIISCVLGYSVMLWEATVERKPECNSTP